MVDEAAKARAEAIEGFAAVLRGLRAMSGNPSFREMSGRSRAISHTTLHEAAQGNRLPSWETTVEFVKACGADPADYRERWDEANRAVRSASALRQAVSARGPIAPPDGRAPVPVNGTAARSTIRIGVDPGPDQRVADRPAVEPQAEPAGGNRRRPRPAVAIAAAAVVAALVVTVVLVTRSDGGDPNPDSRHSSAAALAPADCPVHQANPPAAPPAHTGDASAFIADLTLPDCSRVHSGQTVTKIWRFKNVGTVPWKGYSLHRLDLPQQRDQCQTISDVPIPDTPAGELVDVKTEVTAPPQPGFCFVRFKMVDASGAIAFPGSRPVNFQLIVE